MTARRVREYAALLKSSGPNSAASRKYRSDNAHDLAFLAYASAMVREWRQSEASKNLQKNRRIVP